MADNKFNLYQQLPTTGAEYVHAFTHKGKQYLAVVNNYDGKSHKVDSPVYTFGTELQTIDSVINLPIES